MAKITWLGDEDPSVQSVKMFGKTFVKGEPVTVGEKDRGFDKLKANPMFSFDGKGEVVEAKEPDAPDVEAGTELAALKAELRGLGQEVKGNPSVETLRKRLAEVTAKVDQEA